MVTQIKTTLAHPLLPWQLVLLGMALVLFLAYQVWVLRQKTSWGYLLLITGLRLAIFLLLILFLLNPTILFQKLQRIPKPFAVLVDTSPSMSLQEEAGEGPSRLERVKQVLLRDNAALWKALSAEYDLRLYAVNDTITPLI
ncbi:MAG: hypothetical protein D6736_15150, partial [Nitrospinota bacterium]